MAVTFNLHKKKKLQHFSGASFQCIMNYVSDIAASFDNFYIRVHCTAVIVMEDTEAKKYVYQLILTMHSFDFR